MKQEVALCIESASNHIKHADWFGFGKKRRFQRSGSVESQDEDVRYFCGRYKIV